MILIKICLLLKTLIYYVEFLTKDENIDEWLDKKDKKNVSNRDKEETKFLYEKMGEFRYKFIRAFNKLFRSATPYQNLVQEDEWEEFTEYVGRLKNWNLQKAEKTCNLCSEITFVEPKANSKLKKRLSQFAYTYSSLLGPSPKEFPNSFWSQSISMNICPMCAYLLIHHHLSFTKLSDGSEIFINAPSFKIMWYLNKYAKEIYGKEKIQSTKELLDISLIELASKLYVQLSKWLMMNIEVVSKIGEKKLTFLYYPMRLFYHFLIEKLPVY